MNDAIRITDHALVRYLERVEGVDMDKVREKILSDKIRECIEKLGSGKYPMEGFTLRVVNNVVVTVLTKDRKDG